MGTKPSVDILMIETAEKCILERRNKSNVSGASNSKPLLPNYALRIML